MVWLIDFGVTVCVILGVETSERLLSQQENLKSCIFMGLRLANGSSEPNNP